VNTALYTRSAPSECLTSKELSRLRYFAWERSWQVAGEYIDHTSGGNSERPEFQRLFADASEHRFHIVLFWSLDRFIDEGPLETLDYMEWLTRCGVDYCSASQHYPDITGIFEGAVIDIVAAIARQKRIGDAESGSMRSDRPRTRHSKLGGPASDDLNGPPRPARR